MGSDLVALLILSAICPIDARKLVLPMKISNASPCIFRIYYFYLTQWVFLRWNWIRMSYMKLYIWGRNLHYLWQISFDQLFFPFFPRSWLWFTQLPCKSYSRLEIYSNLVIFNYEILKSWMLLSTTVVNSYLLMVLLIAFSFFFGSIFASNSVLFDIHV